MTNIAAADGYEMFRFGNMAFAGPVVIDNIYGENIVKIGDFTGNAAFPNSVIFHGASPMPWPIPPIPISLSAAARGSGTFPIFPFELRP